MIDQETRELMEYARSLSSHRTHADLAAIFKSAMKAYVNQLEKRKFGSTARPRRQRRPCTNPRTIPVATRRTVFERDGGQCTFESEGGHRCSAREGLHYDHIIPFALGGKSTQENLRLRCGPHNVLEAERTFGESFIDAKRDESRRMASEARARRAAEEEERTRRAADEEWMRMNEEARARAEAEAAARAAAEDQAQDVMVALRTLGFRAEQARRAVERTASMGNVSLEERVKAALRSFAPRPRPIRRESNASAAA